MGWTITSPGGEMSRSYTAVAAVASELAYVLPGRAWVRLRAVVDRRSGDPFAVPAAEAGAVAGLLREAVATGRMSPDAARLADALAASATWSAAAAQSWRWS